jgi:hypothetical protein
MIGSTTVCLMRGASSGLKPYTHVLPESVNRPCAAAGAAAGTRVADRPTSMSGCGIR